MFLYYFYGSIQMYVLKKKIATWGLQNLINMLQEKNFITSYCWACSYQMTEQGNH